ncbi:MAG TPA: hypothetical protein VK640_09805 [Actinomycetes bacterium]|nr:hypothetical protein [Actinomycetes bacterium]
MSPSRSVNASATSVRSAAVPGASRSAAPTSWRASMPGSPKDAVASATDARARCCSPATIASTRSQPRIKSTLAAPSSTCGSIPASTVTAATRPTGSP